MRPRPTKASYVPASDRLQHRPHGKGNMDSDTEFTEYRTEVSETDIASPARPGRFKGPKSTWRTFNEDEIALADSLVKLGAQDLSAHLYNAHVMKKSLYDADLVKDVKPWFSKERWRPAEVGDDGKNFVPPERWTAWPLEPEIVPRGEGTREDEEFTLKRAEEEKPTREMEEVLTGVMLKFAKSTFERRKWEGEEALQVSSDGESGSDSQESQEENPKEDDLNPTDTEAPAQPSLSHPSSSKPIISADDDRSARLLRPTIRHTLTRLDSLLTALQISRRACLRTERSPSPANDPLFSTTETDDRPTTPDTPKRRQGRPRRVISDEPHPLAVSSPPKKSNRGRKKKIQAPLPGETQTEMLSDSEPESEPEPEFESGESSEAGGKGLERGDWGGGAGGVARGGGGAGGEEVRDAVWGGDGEEVPDFGELSEEEEEVVVVEDVPAPRRTRSARLESRTRSRSRSRESRSRMDERSAVGKFGIYAAYCPFQECERHDRGFNNERAVRDHLRINHGMGKEEIQKMEDEEEMIGAVHRDGFGVVVKRRQGWRGGDEGLRKERKTKVKGESAVDESVVGDESEEEGMGDFAKSEYF
ncbi:hypothetical protein V502_05128 [Pseudogymnoascus sp. VKM F-4520 (FW-2644)]|nr:hypothetical protein V502_05128 [Pseudogymnoascus sp. VKM F-4520 (FW-2644)]